MRTGWHTNRYGLPAPRTACMRGHSVGSRMEKPTDERNATKYSVRNDSVFLRAQTRDTCTRGSEPPLACKHTMQPVWCVGWAARVLPSAHLRFAASRSRRVLLLTRSMSAASSLARVSRELGHWLLDASPVLARPLDPLTLSSPTLLSGPVAAATGRAGGRRSDELLRLRCDVAHCSDSSRRAAELRPPTSADTARRTHRGVPPATRLNRSPRYSGGGKQWRTTQRAFTQSTERSGT